MTKTLKTILLILLAVAIATGAVVGIIYLSKSINPTDPGNIDSGGTGSGIVAISDEGEKLYAGNTYVMPKAMTMVAEAPTESNYASSGEFTITATVNGNEYINGVFDFTCYFEDGSDSWATGKDANDYISITPATTNTAKVKLLAAFGAPIEIKAQLVGTDSSATCRVDYLQRITGYTIDHTGTDFGDTVGLDVTVTYSIGTVKGILQGNSGSFSVKDEFEAAFKSLLKFNVTLKNYVITGSDTKYFDTYQIYTYEPTVPLKYSDFIVGFDNLDTKHKEAIYYAWNAAFEANGYGAKKSNLLIDCDFTYSYGGVTVSNISEVDYTPTSGCYVTGNAEGDGLSPDVELNGGGTF